MLQRVKGDKCTYIKISHRIFSVTPAFVFGTKEYPDIMCLDERLYAC